MSLKHIDGFDQFQGQAGQQLLSSLQSAGYAVSNGIVMASGRKAGTYALELQVSAGAGGASWSARTNPVRGNLNAVAANTQGRFVAVGDGGNATTSTDGINWAVLVMGTNKNLRGIACSKGTFIAVGEGGVILRSMDGQIWSERPAPNGAAAFTDVACDGTRWIAVGSAGAAGVIIVSDDDGMTWAGVTENAGARGNLCVEHGDCWVVGGIAGQMLTSDDGLAFTTRVTNVNTDVSDVAFNNGLWLAASGAGTLRSSDKAMTWIVGTADIVPSGLLRALAVSDSRWVIGGELGQLFMSDDGVNWTKPAITGMATTILDINVAAGAQAGWALVGARTAQVNATAPLYVSLAPPTTMSRTFVSTSDKIVIGFAHRATARGRIFSIKDVLNMDWPAGVEILGQRGTSVPIRNVWYYYEVEIDKIANKVRLFVNDTADIEVDLPVAAAGVTSYVMTWEAENGAVARLDDLYLLDGETVGVGALTARLKPISIAIRMPTEDVLTEWDSSSPGEHWPLVGLLPPSDMSYVRSAVSGEQDIYASDTPLPDGAGEETMPIIAVGVMALAQKSDLDNRQLGLVIGQPGNQKEVIDTALSTTLEYSFAVFETGPGDQAWTAESVVSTPFGIAVRP